LYVEPDRPEEGVDDRLSPDDCDPVDLLVTVLDLVPAVVAEERDRVDDELSLIVSLRVAVRADDDCVATCPVSDVRFDVLMVLEEPVADDWLRGRDIAVRPAADALAAFTPLRVVAAVPSVVRVRLIVCRVDSVPVRVDLEVTTAGPDAVMTRRAELGSF
jgi:hypothetical protein